MALVGGGYAGGLVAALAAGWLYDWRMSKMPYDTSGGMYAGGEMLTSIAVFLAVALLPTLLGLWYLRTNHRAWRLLESAALVFAAVGLVASLTFGHTPGRSGAMVLLELLGLAQLLGVPLWALAFTVFAVLAPKRESRRALVVSVAIELVIGAVAFVHWFGPHTRY